MSAEPPKPDGPKKSEPKPKAPAGKPPVVAPTAPVLPLFQKVDWLTFAITTFVVFIGYYFSLAPDLTLEDSGELAVGSMYAGVPHPPGYPVWTLFTWLICELVPFYNIAWRVALASAICGALGCGIIGMMVSRGSAMIIEGFESLKGIEPKVLKAICVVSGYVGGMVMAFNGYLWSQAVIVEVYAISVLSLVLMLVSIMRWMHAPHQSRYIWWASFWLGICFTNHQTLLVAVLGLQVAVLARDAKLGRDVFFGNVLIFLLAGIGMLVAYGSVKGIAASGMNFAYVQAFVIIGLASILESDGYTAVQVTIGSRKASRVVKAAKGHFEKAQVEAGASSWELRADSLDAFSVGGQITVEAFAEGQMVDVTGQSKGKGFQGCIKRWNFSMQDATHGNSRSHRSAGSIGQNQTPGRVYKGKKMAGHMGAERVTTQSLEIVKVDVERNLLLIKGAVPGAPGGDVIVRPAVKARKNG